VKQVNAMGIKEVLSAPRSPWQRAYIERVIGTLRRECLDHVIVFSEAGLYRHLRNFADYYHRSRTHLGLQKDTPEPARSTHQTPGALLQSPRWAGFTIGTSAA
jgi:putative transposase